jgi:predicted TIM-barrel fold metal-dependent hydrolase
MSSNIIVDFHSHFYPPQWHHIPAPSAGPLARFWPLLTNIDAQLEAMAQAGITAKVLSAPTAALMPPGQPAPASEIERLNDHFAYLVSKHPAHLLALATIDAFQGEVAAREAERAVKSLGMGGICVDCAQGDHWLDEPQARPTLTVAAELDVPIFVHPVSPVGLTERMARLGHVGILLARGTENAASILALLRSGLFDELPNLKIVLPMIGAATLLFSGMADQEHGRETGWQGTMPSLLRQRLYVDTMGFDAASIRFAINLLGSEHVLLGSDWPIMPIQPRQAIQTLLQRPDLALTQEEQQNILSTNTLRLLKQETILQTD